MSEVLNPVQCEQEIVAAVNEIAAGIRVVSDAYAVQLETTRVYDRARAKATRRAEGTVSDRAALAELAVADERDAKDAADVAYRYAVNRQRAAEGRLSAWQSLYRGVLAQYGAAGTGER